MKHFSVKQLVLTALFTALISLGAFLKLPIFSLPLTLQTFFVMLSGSLLNKQCSLFSCLLYLCLGLIGLPIFTEGGGFSYVLKPSFGYLLGFPVGAFLESLSLEKEILSFRRCFLACLICLSSIYLIGVPYYYISMHFFLNANLSISNFLISNLLLTIPFDLFLAVFAAKLTVRLKPHLSSFS